MHDRHVKDWNTWNQHLDDICSIYADAAWYLWKSKRS